jgi:hypothetical protein
VFLELFRLAVFSIVAILMLRSKVKTPSLRNPRPPRINEICSLKGMKRRFGPIQKR